MNKAQIIDTTNICQSRYNATGDVIWQSIAAAFVVCGDLSFHELDPRVWTLAEYLRAKHGIEDTSGED